MGSLNTVLLCGCSLECFCERARAMHRGELQPTTRATGSDLGMMGNVEEQRLSFQTSDLPKKPVKQLHFGLKVPSVIQHFCNIHRLE